VTAVRFDLALLGVGHVARTFLQQLVRHRARLQSEYGIEARVVAAATRRRGVAIDPNGIDPGRLLSGAFGAPYSDGVRFIAEAADAVPSSVREGRFVLVETSLLTIADGGPAVDHVRAALMAGAHVITANKGPAAFAYRELAELAARAGRRFLFEAAVMDGIPIFNLARETLPAVTVNGFRGVVNSTTNYMLTDMERGRTFDEALADMQRLGIAEADPSLDVDGWDAAAKAAALANVLLDARITPHDVDRRGIRDISTDDLRAAIADGQRVRLIASARRVGDRAVVRVSPDRIAERDLLARLDGMQNALVLQTDILGDLAIAELSAGLGQTGYALVSDLVAVARSIRGGRR
jgi:homoserine dehydrogenase